MNELTPPDPKRCQCDITEGLSARNMMRLGGRYPKTYRCERPSAFYVVEKEPDNDGQRGSMCVCDTCIVELRKQHAARVDIYPFKTQGELPNAKD